MNLERSVETWRDSCPDAMSKQSTAAIFYAFQDAKHDILALQKRIDELTNQLKQQNDN